MLYEALHSMKAYRYTMMGCSQSLGWVHTKRRYLEIMTRNVTPSFHFTGEKWTKMVAESDKVNARYVQTEKSVMFLELVQKLKQAKLHH